MTNMRYDYIPSLLRIYWPRFIVEVILLICLVLIPSVSIALFLVFVRLCCTPREFLILAHSSTPPGLKQLLDANTNTNANRNDRIIQFKNILILLEDDVQVSGDYFAPETFSTSIFLFGGKLDIGQSPG